MTLAKLRAALYRLCRVLGDYQAVRRNRVGKRVARRVAGKVAGRTLRRLIR